MQNHRSAGCELLVLMQFGRSERFLMIVSIAGPWKPQKQASL